MKKVVESEKIKWLEAVKLIEEKNNRAPVPIDQLKEEPTEFITISNIIVEGCDDLPKSVNHIIFDNVKFKGCKFIDINFTAVFFKKCRFDMCGFQNCTFCGVSTEYTGICVTTFEKCQFNLPRFFMTGVSKCIFNDVKLFYGDMDACTISVATLDHVKWSSGYINRSTITELSIIDAELAKTSVTRSSIINPIHWGNLKIGKYTDFSDCNITPNFSEIAGDPRFGKILTEPIVGYKVVLGGGYKTDIDGNLLCKQNGRYYNSSTVMKLEIPAGAIVFSDGYSNFRTNKAKVLSINDYSRAYSIGNYIGIMSAKYQSWYVGDEVTIKNFDLRYNVQCSTGIHFFKNLDDALTFWKSINKASIEVDDNHQLAYV